MERFWKKRLRVLGMKIITEVPKGKEIFKIIPCNSFETLALAEHVYRGRDDVYFFVFVDGGSTAIVILKDVTA